MTEAYEQQSDWSAEALKETLEAVGERHGLKKGKAQAPIRVAVTGRTVGPPLFEALEVLGREEVVRRLKARRPRERLRPAVRRDPAARYADDGSRAAVVADPTPVGGVVIVRRRRRWPRRIVLSVAVLLLLAIGYYAVTFYQVHATGRSDQARPVDAIVVMGAAQYDGRPSPQLAARLDHAADLWAVGVARVMVVTGGNQPGDRFTEAQASADYLINRGVPADAILQEERGTQLVHVARGVRPRSCTSGAWSRVLVVSDPFHSLAGPLDRCRSSVSSPTYHRHAPARSKGRRHGQGSWKRPAESLSDGSSGSSGCCRSPGERRV